MDGRITISPKLQEQLSNKGKNGKHVVSYLKHEMTENKSQHIGLIFAGENKTARPFFPVSNSCKKEMEPIEKFLKSESVISLIDEIYAEWGPCLDPNSIDSVKSFINDFFIPIELSSDWKEFWKKQVGCEKEIIRNSIASAFFYKAMSLHSKQNPHVADESIQLKLQIFTKIAHEQTSKEVIDYFNDKFLKDVKNRLSTFITEAMISNDCNVPERLNEYANDIRTTILFKTLPNGEELLTNLVSHWSDKITGIFMAFNTFSNKKLEKLVPSARPEIISNNEHNLRRKRTQESKLQIPKDFLHAGSKSDPMQISLPSSRSDMAYSESGNPFTIRVEVGMPSPTDTALSSRKSTDYRRNPSVESKERLNFHDRDSPAFFSSRSRELKRMNANSRDTASTSTNSNMNTSVTVEITPRNL